MTMALSKWFLFVLLFFPIQLYASTLYLMYVDLGSVDSLQVYLDKVGKEIKTKDMLLVFDSKTSQLMAKEIRIDSSRIKKKLRNKLKDKILSDIDKYAVHMNSKRDILVNAKMLTSQNRDLARLISSSIEYIRLYENQFDNIKILLFGDSIYHDAYGHDFNLGVPSDGFLLLPDSEFNVFEGYKTKNVEVRAYYDIEPLYKLGMYRFLDKLVKEKYGVNLSAFNGSVAPNATPKGHSMSAAFFPNELRVVVEKSTSDCGDPDKIAKNYGLNVARLKVEVVNPCRVNTLLSFVHNGKTIQKAVDENGRVSVIFNLLPGLNEIKYLGLSGEWDIILNEEIEPRPDRFEFDLDESTNTLSIKGYNPFRQDGEYVSIDYVNTGASYNLEVKGGRFEKTVAVKPGKNIFKSTDIDETIKEHVFRYKTRCSDIVEYDESLARETGYLVVSLTNACREDDSLVKFLYDNEEYYGLVKDGETKTNIVLKYEINEVFYENFDRTIAKIDSIKVDEFDDLIRLWVNYTDNVFLITNIFEPGTAPNENELPIDYSNKTQYRAGHLHDDSKVNGKGRFIVYDLPALKDYLVEPSKNSFNQIYIVRNKELPEGELYFYLDYFSRHGSLRTSKKNIPPLCGGRSFGGMIVNYNLLYQGATTKSKKFLDPANCVLDASSSELKPQNKDKIMILLSKLDIVK